ncbi:MAG: AAA family ATPase [Mycoplasmataceae bacterium]|nr:AAA family ATPase [Mycoplasmataceae bacterium]
MKLIKVEAKGFKSFADKVTLKFNGGVVGIVGPNGSGKSNINDAIKWVLGEQSSKALRGDNMEDIIFSGSRTEKEQNRCEVTLTFDNSEQKISIPHKIFTISRILERGRGSNTYYINDQIARYRDIREISLESGISKSSLAIISQGTVSDIAQATPEQRRGIIEDAAGTSKYKSKKIDALRKLEKTQESLEKINTVIMELEKQLKPLEKQASKAQIYLSKSKELKEVEVGLLVHDLLNFDSKLEELKKDLGGVQETKEDLESRIKDQEIAIEENVNYKVNLEKEIRELNSDLEKINESLYNLEVRFKNEEQKRELIISGQIQVADSQKIDAMKSQLEVYSSEIQHFEKWGESSVQNVRNKKEEVNNIELNIATLRLKSNTMKTNLLKVKTKVDVLIDHKENKTNLFKGTKTIIDNKSLFKGMQGTVSDIIVVPEQYSSAIESILQNALQHIVVDTSETAIKMIEFLKNNNGGRATFIPLSSIGEKEIRSDYLLKVNNQPGFIGIASELVTADDKYSKLVKFLLGNTIIVEDVQSANKISHLVDKKYLITSLDGDLIRVGGIITGGTKINSSNLLGIEDQIRQLQEIVPGLNKSIDIANSEIAKLENIKEEKQSLINELTIEIVRNNEKHENVKKQFLDLKTDFELQSKKVFDVKSLKTIDSSLNELKSSKGIIQATLRSKREKLELVDSTISRSTISKQELEKSLRLIILNSSEKMTEKTKAEFYVQEATKRLSEHYHLTFESARENFILSLDIKEARDIVSKLKTEIDELGTINIEAINLFSEIKERHDEIFANQEELSEARKIILEAISEMDKIIISRITSTIELVNKEFDFVFKKMFGGGEARVFLVDPHDVLESGVDIQAQPPGKSVKNLKLFSGGEKALIAISLLFAIIKAKPLPLCILDEVEAALDEANVVRYAEFLQSLKEHTQFIVITHRHGTMSRVDDLFGATMQKRGVTTFFSIELSKAKELVANTQEVML